MLMHLRLTVPTELSDEVVELLESQERSANLTVLAGASRSPVGDLSSATWRASWSARSSPGSRRSG